MVFKSLFCCQTRTYGLTKVQLFLLIMMKNREIIDMERQKVVVSAFLMPSFSSP